METARAPRTPAPRPRGRAPSACRECGGPLPATSRAAEFCRPACRKAWNNRRMQRGAEVYDLFMALRYDRPAAKTLSLWRLLCRMAAQFRQEDHDQRAGRRSWQPPRRVLETRPYLQSMVVARDITGRRT